MSSDPTRSGTGSPSVSRHEEELLVAREPTDAGHVRVRTLVDTEAVTEHAETQAEHFDQAERVPADENASGKRLVVRERVIVRKRSVREPHLVEAELRRERIAVEADVADPSTVTVDPSLESSSSCTSAESHLVRITHQRSHHMQLDKQTVLDMIQQHGNSEHVDKADRQLPDKVDTDEHGGMLEQFGLDTNKLKQHLPGGLGGL
jgi:hypothetical protein